jgi:hypothetical protein
MTFFVLVFLWNIFELAALLEEGLLKNIPHALGCITTATSTLIWIILFNSTNPLDAGTSVEYISTSCPSEEEEPLANIPHIFGDVTTVVSTLTWIILVN